MDRRARVFVDHGAFDEAWVRYRGGQRAAGTPEGPDWSRLIDQILERVTTTPGLGREPLDCDTVVVYAYVRPREIMNNTDQYRYLHTYIDQIAGFSVKILPKQKKDVYCKRCSPRNTQRKVGIWEDKGLDTRIATDMLAGALDDHYGIAIVVSDSDELVPAVETVQDVFDKRVLHIGCSGEAENLRSAAWANLKLDEEFCRQLAPLPAGDAG